MYIQKKNNEIIIVYVNIMNLTKLIIISKLQKMLC